MNTLFMKTNLKLTEWEGN